MTDLEGLKVPHPHNPYSSYSYDCKIVKGCQTSVDIVKHGEYPVRMLVRIAQKGRHGDVASSMGRCSEA